MLRSLLEWNRRRKEWNAQHVVAWAGATKRGTDGLSSLQHICESRLNEHLAVFGSRLTDRDIVDTATLPWIRARIEDADLSIWIHDDTAGLDTRTEHTRFEEWDYRTPEELSVAFTEAVISAVKAARQRAV